MESDLERALHRLPLTSSDASTYHALQATFANHAMIHHLQNWVDHVQKILPEFPEGLAPTTLLVEVSYDGAFCEPYVNASPNHLHNGRLQGSELATYRDILGQLVDGVTNEFMLLTNMLNTFPGAQQKNYGTLSNERDDGDPHKIPVTWGVLDLLRYFELPLAARYEAELLASEVLAPDAENKMKPRF